MFCILRLAAFIQSQNAAGCAIILRSLVAAKMPSAVTAVRLSHSRAVNWSVGPVLISKLLQGGPKNHLVYALQQFLQRVSIACYAERCTSYSKSVRPSVCPSVCLSVTRWYCVKTTHAIRSCLHWRIAPLTLVSSRLTSPQTPKGNTGSRGAEWDTVEK